MFAGSGFRAATGLSLGLLLVPLTAVDLKAAEAGAVPDDHAAQMARGLELFRKEIRPLLVDQCLKCHGGEKVKGGLDLTTREGFLAGGENGVVVVAGAAKSSKLLKLVRHEEDPHMPSKAAKLGDAQIASLAQWIDLGAPYDQPLVAKGGAASAKERVITDDDRKWWAFRPLATTPVPAATEPGVAVRNPIDRFIQASLAARGLRPAPPADRRTLLRRACFDLTGLPPTPEEVAQFERECEEEARGGEEDGKTGKRENGQYKVSSSRFPVFPSSASATPGAYERLVDRLLASPHFGERWARHWLDVARFAESHGFEHDYDRPNAWHFRDFVVRAFNQDLPYDTFVKWQLAGDEYEPTNPLALAATGFLAAGTHATQITANQVEKERYDELDDMTRTTAAAMLGLTVGCARCHDHKFDPIPTRDYYRLLATFTTTVRSDYDVDMDPGWFAEAKARWDGEHTPLVAALKHYEEAELPGRLDQWITSGAWRTNQPKWQTLTFVEARSHGGATFTNLGDGSLLATGKNPDFDTYTFVAKTTARGITAVRLEALAHPSMVKGGPGRAPNGNIGLGDFKVTIAPLDGRGPTNAVKLVNPKATFEQKGLPIAAAIDGDVHSGWAVDPQFGKDHAAVFETEGDVGFEGGSLLTFTLNFQINNQHNIGRPRLSLTTVPRPVSLDGDAMPAEIQGILATLTGGAKSAAQLDSGAEPESFIRVALRREGSVLREPSPSPFWSGSGGREKVPGGRMRAIISPYLSPLVHSSEASPKLEVESPGDSGGPSPVPSHLTADARGEGRALATLSAADRQKLLAWFAPQDAGWREANARVEEHGKAAPKPRLEKMMISSEGVPAIRLHTQGGDFLEQTHFLKRGDSNQKLAVAEPGFLQVLMRAPDAEKHWQTPPPAGWRTSYRRRALAEWMTDVDAGAGHLLARVIVNRVWQHHFGRGLVGTPNDFGVKGEPPTHPELLDWLASELIRGGWKLKPIHKLILTSATYQQSGVVDARSAAADSENTLYWRRSPGRLEAELIRDSMLAVSGVLDERLSGPSTLDPQQKRRSLYFTVKRSKLVPMMVVFDWPDALGSLDRRASTTVAPQGLLLINSPIVRGYADAFARRVAAPSTADSIQSAYRLALARRPAADEAAAAEAFVAQQEGSYAEKGKVEARQAALADFCQVLFGLNEFAFVE